MSGDGLRVYNFHPDDLKQVKAVEQVLKTLPALARLNLDGAVLAGEIGARLWEYVGAVLYCPRCGRRGDRGACAPPTETPF
jgi:hypothetical protein